MSPSLAQTVPEGRANSAPARCGQPKVVPSNPRRVTGWALEAQVHSPARHARMLRLQRRQAREQFSRVAG
jgi:hypothetical protein